MGESSRKERIDFTRYKVDKITEKRGEAIPDQEVFAEALEQVVSLVKPGHTVHWYSKGDWSMWQLLEKLLIHCGCGAKGGHRRIANLHISSYAFSETSARMIARMKDQQMISRLCCLLDNRTDTRSAGSLQLLRGIAEEVALISTHAKVTLIYTAEHTITVTGSANYTENLRYEAGTISSNRNVYSFNRQWMDKEFSYGADT